MLGTSVCLTGISPQNVQQIFDRQICDRMQLNLSNSKVQKKFNTSTIFSSPTRMFGRSCNAWYSNEYQSVFGEDFEQKSATIDNSKVSLLSKQWDSAANATLCKTLQKPREHNQVDKQLHLSPLY